LTFLDQVLLEIRLQREQPFGRERHKLAAGQRELQAYGLNALVRKERV
jgi:hypothetical protein